MKSLLARLPFAPRAARCVASLCLLAELGGCGGGGGVPAASAPVSASINSVSAASVEVGKSFTIAGSNLDRVSSFTVNGVALHVIAVSAGSATLAMPDTAVSGMLTLVINGASVATGYSVTAYPAVTVGAYAPSSAPAGTTVQVTGSGLGTVSQVRFANGSTAAVALPHGETGFSFIVPEGAASGMLTVASAYGEAGAGNFTVYPTVMVSSISSSSDSVLRVTVLGSNLNAVTVARVGSADASIVELSATRLVLTVPLGSAGNVVLTSPAGNLNAGAVSSQHYTIGTVDVAQVFSRNITNTTLKLTPGRPMLVRASVLGLVANLDSPAITLRAMAGNGALLGALPMSGPAKLPTSRDEYDLANTFSVVVPAAWTQSGLQLVVAAANTDGTVVTGPLHTPAIGASAKMHLVLVPLSYNGATASVPADLQAVKEAFLRTYPYGAADITISVRGALAISGSGTTADFSWWANALPQVEAARSAENAAAFYYGLVHKDSVPGIVGLGYVNDRYSGAGWPSAIGIEADHSAGSGVDPFGNLWTDWQTTMLHEIGHNHSLKHVDGCSLPDSPDPAYPYAGGALGPMPVYDSLYGGPLSGSLKRAVYGPSNTPMKDVMSYCADAAWLSDYSYGAAQTFAQARTGTYPAPRVLLPDSDPGDYLTVSGSIGAAGVNFNPAEASSRRRYPAVVGTSHDYTLRVHTSAGQRFDYAFDAVLVGDGEAGLRHFNVSLPNPGEVSSIEVLYKGAQLVQPAALNTAAGGAPSFAAQSADGRLELAWNASTEPAATVVYVAADGGRTLLAKNVRGGRASIDISGLPAGGSFEVSLSTSFKARLLKVVR